MLYPLAYVGPTHISMAADVGALGCQGIMVTLVTSGDLVRPLSNNGAACYD